MSTWIKDLILEAESSRFGQAPRNFFVGFLNDELKELHPEVVRRLEAAYAEEIKAGTHQLADIPKLRASQRELRELVDLYLEPGSRAEVERRLRDNLRRTQYTIEFNMLEENEGEAQKDGPVAAIRTSATDSARLVGIEYFLSFADFLASPQSKRLRKCPKCKTYFLATERRTRKFCSAECGSKARSATYQKKLGETYTKRQREKMKSRRQLKKQPTT